MDTQPKYDKVGMPLQLLISSASSLHTSALPWKSEELWVPRRSRPAVGCREKVRYYSRVYLNLHRLMAFQIFIATTFELPERA